MALLKKPAVIFDIDGTIACCEHRRHFVAGPIKDWEGFFAGIDDDSPIRDVVELVNFMSSLDREILLVTGRSENLRLRTETWLDNHAVYFDKLLMRANEDYSADTAMKAKIYKERIEPYYEVKLVLEDRYSVVAMYRSLGLTVWQVAEGNF